MFRLASCLAMFVVLICLSASLAEAQTLLYEGFEGDLSNWTGKEYGSHHGIIVTDPLAPGNQVLSFSEVDNAGDVFSIPAMDLQLGSTYTFSIDYLGLAVPGSTPDDFGGFAGLAGDVNDIWAGGAWFFGTRASYGDVVEHLIDDGQWRTYSYTFVWDRALLYDTLDDTVHVYIEDHVTSGPSVGDVFFDNVSISTVPIPEPSTIILLTMGAVGLLAWVWRNRMSRIARRVAVLMFVVSCICSAHEVALAQPADSAWPVFGQGAGGKRQSPFVGPSSAPQHKWVFQADDTVYASPAITADGSILVPTFGGTLYSLDQQSGEPNWMFQSGEQMSCSPSVDVLGTIYQKTSRNGLYALNSDGSIRWVVREPKGYRSGTAIGSDGTVYVGQSTEPRLLAYSPDGSMKWARSMPNQVEGTPVIDPEGTIYVGAEDARLHAVDADGTEKWSFHIPGRNVASATIGDDGTIYAGGQSGDLFAINPDGSQKWKFSEASDIYTAVALAHDGSIYLAASDGIYALDPDGTKDWFYPDRSYVHGSPMVDAAGHIFVSRDDRVIFTERRW